jgi:two-component system response regulator PilR (NtrC family)
VSPRARILVVDDERSMQEFLEICFRREGYDVATAGDVDSGLALLEADDFDVAISDLQMPGRSGLELLRAVREISPETAVILITAFGTTETAIAAMKEGAYDYVTKPFKVDEIRLVVEKALEKKLLASENRRLRSELQSQLRQRELIGTSSAMHRIYELVNQVAETRTNVLLAGESGTGKELVARAIHARSDRRDRTFVAINCGAIPENLLESELFGHVKGAFTGAFQGKEGLFETADGGTLLLDEVGELPAALQVKLLRVLQERTIRRVGGTSDRRVDVRILAATNRRLEEEVAAGRFREDLYYRLNVIQIALPPLRERLEDVPLLVQHFVDKYSRELGKPIREVREDALRRLLSHSYPGNVRELENLIERAVALSKDGVIGEEALPPQLLRPPEPVATERVSLAGVDLEALVNEYERGLLLEALRRSRGVKKRAAQLLGISFRSFRYRLEKLGLDAPADDEE